MNRRLPFLITLLTVCAAMWGPTTSAHAACGKSFWGGEAGSCNSALTWRYDRDAQTFVREDVIYDRAAEGLRYSYELNERCNDSVDCGAAVYPCPARDGVNGRMYQSVAHLLLTDGSRAAVPSIVRNVCVYPGVSVPLAAVEAAAHEEISKRLAAPSVVSSPPGRSLVGLLTIFSTPAQPEPSIRITQPVPGEISAQPAYVWDFGDGLNGLGPGLPYQVGDLPSRLPGKYLGATYATGGTKHVTLTVTWSVHFRLEGVTDVALAPILFTAAADKEIATARAVLVK